MSRPTHHIAQLNVARLLEPLDTPRLADFVAALDPINALADSSPGFVWRLQAEGGDATSIRVYDDEMIIVNMSVWESIEALAAFVYKGPHTQVMRRRREWFEHLKDAYTALWWLPAGELPSVADAQRRLEQLRQHGPSEVAFGFKRPFPPPDGKAAPTVDGGWLCPA
jgi:hypothetical protein